MSNYKAVAIFLFVIIVFLSIRQTEAGFVANHFIYLPIVSKIIPPILVADFENIGCVKSLNNLGGEMGAAYKPETEDRLYETYEFEADHSCVVKLDYKIPDQWSAFWLKLQQANLTQQQNLSFEVKFEEDSISKITTDMEIKVELKRGCHDQKCDEVWIQYVPDITEDWQQRSIRLENFYSEKDMSLPPPLVNIEELVFTFEQGHISERGVVYLDNIEFSP